MAYYLPAEWAEQRFVQLSWPYKEGDFADFAAVEANFVALTLAITRFQPVRIAARHPQAVAAALDAVDAPSYAIYGGQNNDVWARDHGPITVFDQGKPLLLDFIFNGWGNKFEASLDNALTRHLHNEGFYGDIPIKSLDFVLEGGGIETDGKGTLLTTERCLLAPTRNPIFSRTEIEAQLKDWLGVRRVLWLKHGDLLGDDTDGHIDTTARFADPYTIVYQGCDDPSDAHYADLTAMAAELAAFRTTEGQPYKLIALPLPDPIYSREGRRLPAGYANFLIINGAVLMPTYQDRHDDLALDLLASAFPDREVVPVDCRALIEQYGSLHCVTMQVPKAA
jgi:agmatine/peptidylarginine deiminase